MLSHGVFFGMLWSFGGDVDFFLFLFKTGTNGVESLLGGPVVCSGAISMVGGEVGEQTLVAGNDGDDWLGSKNAGLSRSMLILLGCPLTSNLNTFGPRLSISYGPS